MRRSVIGPILGTLVLLGGVGVGGWAVYQAGYRSGLAESATEVIVHQPGFSGIGLFFGFLFLLFLFSMVSKLFFFRRWRRGTIGPNHGEGSPMERRLHDWHERQHGREEKPTQPSGPDLT